jgi:hypothetical protein
VFRDATERPFEIDRFDAARRIRPVDEVADLRGRVADRPEGIGDGDRVVDRRRVVVTIFDMTSLASRRRG